MIDLLSKLEDEKDKWIYQAIDVFDEGFLRFDGKKYDKDQVLIGVYGPTQVGKTTLILTLLGIGDEHMGPLFDALRGKRLKGISSTITSFIYKRSEDDNFYLVFPDKTKICCSNLDELEEELEEIRRQIEDGEVTFSKPIILEIAKSFFTNRKFLEISKNIVIIDLPGDETKEKREEEYVQHILNAYLPFCSACLMMEISSKMVRLFQLNRPTVKDWMYDPQTFRLVLTRSLQSTSMKSAIASGEIQSLDEFRQYYKYHLQRNDERNNDHIPNNIYPLEFGDSWLELKQKDSLVFQKAKGWMEQLFLELLEDLNAVKTPENQIMQIKNMGHSIRRQKKQELEGMKIAIQQIKNSIEEEKKSIENYEAALSFLNTEIAAVQEELKCLEEIKLEQFRYSLVDQFEYDKKGNVSFKDRKTDKLIETFDFLELDMLSYYEKQMSQLMRKIKNVMVSVDETPRLDLRNTPPIIQLALKHEGLTNQYYLLKNYDEDFSIVRETLSTNNVTIYEYYQKQFNRMKENCSQFLKELLQTKENYYRFAEEKVKEKKAMILDKENVKKDVMEKLDHATKELNQDLERPLKLDEILKTEFVKAVSELQTKLLSPVVSDAERWAYHQYSQIMLKQAERIIENDYF